MFLITPGIELEHPSLVKAIYNKEDPYCNNKDLHDLFVNTLQEIGYDCTNTLDICFTDISKL